MTGDYYNEWDPFAAAWLRELIKEGLIPDGEVDERSVLDVRAADLRGFTRCHFFAGIGGWPYALRLAGRKDDRPGWTASLPCQPLSCAGDQLGHADERHLWPAFHDLVAECRPPEILGEQVASSDGREWFAGVRLDLEDLGYACGAADLCAASIGAPHIRQRLFWVAYAQDADRRGGERGAQAGAGPDGIGRRRSSRGGADSGGLADPTAGQFPVAQRGPEGRDGPGSTGALNPDSRLAHPDGGDASPEGLQRGGQHGQRSQDGGIGDRLGDAEGTRLALGKRDAGNAGQDHGAPARERPEQAGGLGEGLGHAQSGGRREQRHAPLARDSGHADGTNAHPWRSILIPCADGKWRRIPADETGQPEPSLFPLASGVPNRMGTLRGAGNAICAPVAAKFIRACDEARQEIES